MLTLRCTPYVPFNTVDSTPNSFPYFLNLSHSNNQLVHASPITLTGTIQVIPAGYCTNSLEIKLNEGSYEPVTGFESFSVDVPVTSGSNTISFKAMTDLNYNETNFTLIYSPS